MKLIFLVHSLRGGGAERLVLELAASAKQLNASIEVVSWLNINDYNEKNYSSIKPTYLIEEESYKWPLSLFKSFRKLNRILKDHEPDAVFIFSHTVMWLAALSKINTKYINVILGHSQISKGRGWKTILYRPLDIFVSRFLNLLMIAPTESLIDSSSKYFMRAKEYSSLIRNGVEVERIDVKPMDSNKFEIAMLGTLSFHKGQHLAIQCMKKLIQDHKNISLNIIGKGSIESDLTSMLEENGLSRNDVKILGRRDDAFEIMANSDLFWHLSMSEGMPLAVIEAMALGLPIIGFDVEGVRDVVINNENGYLVDYEDLDTLASKTTELILNKELRKVMQEKSINEYNSKYTKNKMVLSYEEFLQNLL